MAKDKAHPNNESIMHSPWNAKRHSILKGSDAGNSSQSIPDYSLDVLRRRQDRMSVPSHHSSGQDLNTSSILSKMNKRRTSLIRILR